MQLNYRDRKKYQEGFEKGKKLRDVEIICTLLDDFTNEEIAKNLKFPIEKIEKVREEYLFGDKE